MTLTIARAVETITGPDFPLRVEAYDHSGFGPRTSPITVRINDERAIHYVATAPNSLGLARAYLMDAISLQGVHPADPYPVFEALTDLKLRRPGPKEVADLLAALGLTALKPAPVPALERAPRWRRLAEGHLTHSRSRDAASIHHHYDVSNAFYRKVLGETMAYTCACYPTPVTSLDDAQRHKFDLVASKLALRPGQRLLDVGCGWGTMVLTAARRGVKALGVTLSRQQASWAQEAIEAEGLGHLAEVRHQDYRDVREGGFDAVSSIGLTEHIGVANYPEYFRFLRSKVRPGGLLLNHCITRRTTLGRHRAKGFIDRYVFPDGELTGVGAIITAMQNEGWEVRHEENLREHYAMTLRDWCANLRATWDDCVRDAGAATAKVWGLYLAGSRSFFATNAGQLHQVLAVNPGADGRSGMPLRPTWTP